MKQTLCALIAAFGIVVSIGCAERTNYDCEGLTIGKEKVTFIKTVAPFIQRDQITVVAKDGSVGELIDDYGLDNSGHGTVNRIEYTDADGESYTGYRNHVSWPFDAIFKQFENPRDVDEYLAEIKQKILAAKRD